MIKSCINCGKGLEEDALFCPSCGMQCTQKQELSCSVCNKTNEGDARFCKQCGADLAKQMVAATTTYAVSESYSSENLQMQADQSIIGKIQDWYRSYPYAKVIVGTTVVFLLSVIGAFIYYNYASESRYLVKYGEASRKIVDANDVLINNIANENLKMSKITDIQQLIQQQKNEIDRLEKDFNNQKSPEKYAHQQKNITELLRLENSILQQTILIITNPMNAETDNLLSSIKVNIDMAKDLATQIQVPNTTITFSSDMTVLPHQLTIYVEEKRKANKEKMDRLAAMNEFFKKVDSMLQRYDGAKTDLGGLLENLRNGGYTWYDYFGALNQARSFRVGMRSQVDSLNAPNGAENLKRQLSEVLTQSVQYCDKMNAAANVEYRSNLYVAEPKYKEAKTINAGVQSSYEAFVNNYQTEKMRLTNIDNL